MGTILQNERETYREVWQIPKYGVYSPGEDVVDMFIDMAQTTMMGSILDAGCGSGKGALALHKRGFVVSMCDITDEGLVDEAKTLPFYEVCLWHNIIRRTGPRDWVYCCDVLEHVPTPFTMLVVQRLLEVARRGVFLSIATQRDENGAWVGKSLHQTVQTFVQWRDQLSELGRVKECRDRTVTGLYLLEPK